MTAKSQFFEVEQNLTQAESLLTATIVRELEKLSFIGNQPHLSGILLLKRIVAPRDFKLPNAEEVLKKSSQFRFLNQFQVVRALIVQSEVQTLRASGLNVVDAIQTLISRVSKDTVSFDKDELQVLHNAIYSKEEMVSEVKCRLRRKEEKVRKRRTSSPTAQTLILSPEMKKKRL